jgi:hypothetical protein
MLSAAVYERLAAADPDNGELYWSHLAQLRPGRMAPSAGGISPADGPARWRRGAGRSCSG